MKRNVHEGLTHSCVCIIREKFILPRVELSRIIEISQMEMCKVWKWILDVIAENINESNSISRNEGEVLRSGSGSEYKLTESILSKAHV